MIEFRPLQPEDLVNFRVNAAEQSHSELMCEEYGEVLATMPISVTAVRGVEPVALFGLQHIWPGRALAWSLIGKDVAGDMVAITRKCRKLMNNSGYRRIEMHVIADFGAGERWARMLGFRFEGNLARFMPDGRDATMWARVQNGH